MTLFIFYSDSFRSINNSYNSSSLSRFSYKDLKWISCRCKYAADFLNVFDPVKTVDRETISQDNYKNMSGIYCTSIFSCCLFKIIFVAIVYHALTWFKLFPLTMPPMIVNGKKVPPNVVVGSGWTAAVVAALALLGLVWGIAA